MMIRGRVIGHVWSTKRVEALPQGALLEVELASGARLIAFDPLGCGDGEEVLITQGAVAVRTGAGGGRRSRVPAAFPGPPGRQGLAGAPIRYRSVVRTTAAGPGVGFA